MRTYFSVTYLPNIFIFCIRTVSLKSNDPCFYVFLMEAGVMTFEAHCTSSFEYFKTLIQAFVVVIFVLLSFNIFK